MAAGRFDIHGAKRAARELRGKCTKLPGYFDFGCGFVSIETGCDYKFGFTHLDARAHDGYVNVRHGDAWRRRLPEISILEMSGSSFHLSCGAEYFLLRMVSQPGSVVSFETIWIDPAWRSGSPGFAHGEIFKFDNCFI
ncbi:hypothetical protein [Burkholderia ubonensis]|uniref:hypothetical protein n=1 Tax=Burkholderia ubonensis TaxID=101571 RepID=UPI001055F241|nr:hypothetical protein [Burkholderia ubonensis]